MRILLGIFAFFGVLLVLSIGVLMAIGFFAYNKSEPMKREASEYADESIAAYGAAWDPQEILDRAGPELQEVLDADPNGIADPLATSCSGVLGN